MLQLNANNLHVSLFLLSVEALILPTLMIMFNFKHVFKVSASKHYLQLNELRMCLQAGGLFTWLRNDYLKSGVLLYHQFFISRNIIPAKFNAKSHILY